LPATNAKRLRKGAQATKQSILSRRGDMDCFAALAMTETVIWSLPLFVVPGSMLRIAPE